MVVNGWLSKQYSSLPQYDKNIQVQIFFRAVLEEKFASSLLKMEVTVTAAKPQ